MCLVTSMNFISLVLWMLSIIVILKIISIVYHDYVLRKALKDIPSTGGYPLIGSAFTLTKKSADERLKSYLSSYDRFKDGLFLEWLGTIPTIHIFKPEFVQTILISTVNIDKGFVYNMLKPWLGNGLVISSGLKWFHDRKHIRLAFHFDVLEQYATVALEKAEILIKCLDREIKRNPGKAVDVFPFANNVAFDIICDAVMGINVHAQEGRTEYVAAMHRIHYLFDNADSHWKIKLEKESHLTFEESYLISPYNRFYRSTVLTFQRIHRPWYWCDWFYYLMPIGKEYKSILNVLHGFSKKIIHMKKNLRQLEANKQEKNEDDYKIGKQKRQILLDLLLDINKKDNTQFSDDEINEQVNTFLFGGHETTAVTITWTLFCLGNNMEQQEKVHEELAQVFKDNEELINVKKLSQLKYLDRVIKETLRLYPSFPFISRKLVEDVTFGDFKIPKGITILLPIILIHRNPEVWKEPLKFDPDRYLPENSKHRNPYAYIPFSAGLRNCIGQKLAQLELKIVLTAILRKWRIKSIKTDDTVKYKDLFSLQPCEEIMCHFIEKT